MALPLVCAALLDPAKWMLTSEGFEKFPEPVSNDVALAEPDDRVSEIGSLDASNEAA